MILLALILGFTVLLSSFYFIERASVRPANGELKRLDRMEYGIKQLNIKAQYSE